MKLLPLVSYSHMKLWLPFSILLLIASVGLPDFPYLAARGNIGLYICKGTWISGINPSTGRLLRSSKPD